MSMRCVLLSPILLDQQYPRSEDELRVGSQCLGNIIESVRLGELQIVVTPLIVFMLEQLDTEYWLEDPHRSYQREIAWQLASLILMPNATINVLRLKSMGLHPIPKSTYSDRIAMWAEEAQALLNLHDSLSKDGYFIGVLCPFRFQGEPGPEYEAPLPERYFPQVGSDAQQILRQCHSYRVPRQVKDQHVTYRDLQANYRAIDGVKIVAANGDHMKVIFRGGRSWVFDSQGKAGGAIIRDSWIKEIEEILHCPWQAIKASLLDGSTLASRRYCLLDQNAAQGTGS
jgi:hypothetical protein